ncbi:MAG: threonine/serine dehydratase [Acidobacteria bacterium]|nr:MAG: threonine/serine dehydratase [Acidobacteriota bacterium]
MSFIMMDSPRAKFQIDTTAIAEARKLLAPYIRTTPVLPSTFDSNVFLKAETLQVTGSFKVRTAFSQLLHLSAEAASRGIVTTSSGNFAIATAYAGHRLRVSTRIVMMRSANPVKMARTKRWGGEIAPCDDRFEARAEVLAEIVRNEGRTEIAPYDHPHAVLGSTTLGAEIVEQFPEVENIAVPISGGGLIAGVAVGAKTLKPRVRVWGVQPDGSNATYLSFKVRDYRQIDKARTIADGLGVTKPGQVTFPLILQYVDDVVTVSEAAILEAVRHLHEEERLVVEPSGAVTLAAVMHADIPRRNTVLVLSGGNIAPEVLKQALEMPTP